MPPELLTSSPSHDSVLLCTVVVLFVLVSVNFRAVWRYADRSLNGLLTMRPRANVFDEPASSDVPVAVLMAVQFVVYAGFLLYLGACRAQHPMPSYTPIGLAAVAGIVAVYYLLQVGVYNLLGYVFATPDNRRRLVAAFEASQALTGMVLVVPALTVIFYPGIAVGVVAVSLVVYFAARFTFIFKGFRIFHHNFTSILYFILYLCTLEIIPAVHVFFAARWVVENLR